MENKKKLLIVLLACLGLVVLYNVRLLGGRGHGNDRPDARGKAAPALRLHLLQAERPPYPGVRRDIFSIGAPGVRKASSSGMAESQPALTAQPISDEAPALSELAAFAGGARLMGALEGPGGRRAFISRGADVYTVSKGDRLEARFAVEEITNDSVVVRDIETGERSEIR